MREISSSGLYKMMYNLPEGKCFAVDIHDISRAILVLLDFTGPDLMGGCTRFEDIERFIKTYSENLKLDIRHNEFKGRLSFYKLTDKQILHDRERKQKMPTRYEWLDNGRGIVNVES